MSDSTLKGRIINLIMSNEKYRKLIREILDDTRYHLLFESGKPDIYDALVTIKNNLFGRMIRLEASSVCQLRCRACSTARGKNRKGVIGWGFLKFDNFRRLIDENPDIRTIEISNWGEIFLNPELERIVRYAFHKNVRLKAANGVNLNTVSPSMLESLVKYRFNYLNVSLDGASHETYKIYRRKGSFHQVIRNVEMINEFKKKYESNLPKMSWQFVVFGHNEHEIDKAAEMARDLGMEFRPKLNHTPQYSPVVNSEMVKTKTGIGAASRDEFDKLKRKAYSRPCTQLWDSPQINWDGALLGCCVNKFGSFGNVFEEGLDGALNNEKFTYAKQMIAGLVPPREDIPCLQCKVWKKYNGDERTLLPSSTFEYLTHTIEKILTQK